MMTRQEEIREGIAEYLWDNRAGETTVSDWADTWAELPEMNKEGYREDAGAFMIYLHSQGVVIQVDRELTNVINTNSPYYRTEAFAHGVRDCKEAVKNADFAAFERLIDA